VDLTGYSLTDDAEFPGKWVFPSVTLAAGQIWWCLPRAQLTAVGGTNKLHTSFTLNSRVNISALYNAESPRALLSDVRAGVSRTAANYSYGYDSTTR